MINQDRGNYFRDLRRRAHLTRLALAQQAECDPSYVTLIERDGYGPSTAICERIVRALVARNVPEVDALRWMLMCGRTPPRLLSGDPGLLSLFLEAFALPASRQRELATSLRSRLRVEAVS